MTILVAYSDQMHPYPGKQRLFLTVIRDEDVKTRKVRDGRLLALNIEAKECGQTPKARKHVPSEPLEN